MLMSCEKCHGAAAPAASMRTFEYAGLTLHCLAFASSCVVCGHQWEDKKYEAVNLRYLKKACAVALRQHPGSSGIYASATPIKPKATGSRFH